MQYEKIVFDELEWLRVEKFVTYFDLIIQNSLTQYLICIPFVPVLNHAVVTL
jgi:hypothetical protein